MVYDLMVSRLPTSRQGARAREISQPPPKLQECMPLRRIRSETAKQVDLRIHLFESNQVPSPQFFYQT